QSSRRVGRINMQSRRYKFIGSHEESLCAFRELSRMQDDPLSLGSSPSLHSDLVLFRSGKSSPGMSTQVTPSSKHDHALQPFNLEIQPEGWEAGIASSRCTELVFQRGERLLLSRAPILLPICLNNGFYSRENIYRLLRFVTYFSNEVTVFFTDGPAKHNYV